MCLPGIIDVSECSSADSSPEICRSAKTCGGGGGGDDGVSGESSNPAAGGARGGDTKLVDTGGQLGANSWNQSPHTWLLGQGTAAVVNFGLFEVVGGISRVQPSTFYDGDKNALCMFQG